MITIDFNPLSLLLAAAVVLVVLGGILNRLSLQKGIGKQFIRFIALGAGIPIVGILAIQGTIEGTAAAAIIGAGMGYAFGKAV